MNADFLNDDRLMELLAQEAIEGLSAAERMELETLLAKYPGADRQVFERTAASLLLASDVEADAESLPVSLRAKLNTAADEFAIASREGDVHAVTLIDRRRQTQARSNSKVLWFALAASLAIAVIGWWPRLMTQGSHPQVPVAHEIPEAERIAAAREQLAANPNVIKRDWTATKDVNAPAVTGDVVWDNATQTGYVRFSGLPANDPQSKQYQLWIFDAKRSDKFPINGGVFDVRSDGEVIVPIHARIPVLDPAMFAVTLEQAGGVVVSEREHILVLAKVAAG
jgi:hypothetical protein